MKTFEHNSEVYCNHSLGCGATTFFLVNGLFKFGRKDSEGSQVAIQIVKWSEFTGTFLQKMMRGRIVAQGFTIMALLTGIVVSVRNSHAEGVQIVSVTYLTIFAVTKKIDNQMRKNTWVPPSSDPNGQVQ